MAAEQAGKSEAVYSAAAVKISAGFPGKSGACGFGIVFCFESAWDKPGKSRHISLENDCFRCHFCPGLTFFYKKGILKNRNVPLLEEMP